MGLRVTFEIGGETFEAVLESDGQGGMIVAGGWERTDRPLGFTTLAAHFGWDLSALRAWDIRIDSLLLAYRSADASVRFRIHSENYGLLTCSRSPRGWEILFSGGPTVSFRRIPLVGSYFSEQSGFEIRKLRIGSHPAPGTDEASYVHIALRLFGQEFTPTVPLRLPTGDRADAAAGGTGEVSWLALKKSVGPITLYRLGVAFVDGRIQLHFELGISLAGLLVVLDGLYFSLAASLELSSLSAGLNGLEVSLKTSFMELGGGFARVPSAIGDRYGGKLVVRIGKFALTAYGYYEGRGEYASVFVYVLVRYPLGGPGAFFITGLAAAVGFNFRLALPEVARVGEFPLVKAARDPSGAPAPDGNLSQIVSSLGGALVTERDTNFFSVGVAFTTYGIVKSFVLATACIGREMEFSVLGVAEAAVPPAAPDPLLYIRFLVRCAFNTGTGVFSLEAALGPESHLLSRQCRLTGGLAAFFWTRGEHQGDFVITLGGYRAGYAKPAHYPTVPRLGLSWAISRNLSLVAEAYFALTPDRVMAGGRMSLTYSAGPFSAWVKLSCDLEVCWKPLHYDLRASVRIGASLRIDFWFIHTTFRIEIGGDIHIYGPEFSGSVTIRILFVSVTIRFGSGAQRPPPPLSWPEFRRGFLDKPGATAPEPLLAIHPAGGLVREIKTGGETAWLMDPHALRLSVALKAPATSVWANGRDIARYAGDVGVKPMGLARIESVVEITVSLPADASPAGDAQPSRIDAYTVEVLENNLPSALWNGSTPLLRGAFHEIAVGVAPSAPTHASPAADRYYALPAAGEVRRTLPRGRIADDGADRAAVRPTTDALLTLRLLDRRESPLAPGRYEATATQTLRHGATLLERASVGRTFHVGGDRFALPPGAVTAQYPAPGATGDFSGQLPHVVLGHPAFPWQSPIGRAGRKIPVEGPSAALLVFPADLGAEIREVALTDVCCPPAGVAGPDIRLDETIGEMPDSVCRVVDIPVALLCAALPRLGDLPFLAHVRQAPDDAKAEGSPAAEGVACIHAVTPPAPAADGGARTYWACLVSLRGHGARILPDDAPDAPFPAGPAAPGTLRVRLVLYAQWAFACAPAKQDFPTLFRGLSMGPLMAPPEGGESGAASARRRDGFVALPHRRLDGRMGRAWYRGPLVPPDAAATPAPPTPGETDATRDAARGLGRLLALRDVAFASTLLDWRAEAVRTSVRAFERSERWNRAAAFPPPDRDPSGNDGADGRYAWLTATAEALLTPTDTGKRRRPVMAPADAHIPAPTLAERFLAFCDTRAAGAEEDSAGPDAADAPDPADRKAEIERWLARARLLYSVPLAYLVPDGRLLPPESLRYFRIDPLWLDVFAEGVLAVGSATPVDRCHDRVAAPGFSRAARRRARRCRSERSRASGPVPRPVTDTPEAEDGAGTGEQTGFLLRSELVAAFGSGLELYVLDAEDRELPPLRIEKLNDETLFCLFDGTIRRLRLVPPPEQIHFAVDEGDGRPGRIPRNPADGAQRPGKRFAVSRRTNGNVSFARTAAAMAAAVGRPVSTSDAFALQMLGGAAAGVVDIEPEPSHG